MNESVLSARKLMEPNAIVLDGIAYKDSIAHFLSSVKI